MNPESCPKPEELRSFVRCSLSEPEADSISDHLERCPACEETVVGLERDGDTIAERIKQAAAQPTFAHEPECQQMLQSLLDAAVGSPAESPSAGADFPIAQSLRDYQIVAKLGEGGMGTVYKAVHQRLKKTVALKVLPTQRIGDQPAVARFEREMEVLGQLNHPHIVQALDAGEHDGQHYLVMEYVEGCDLSDIVKRCSPLSIADACLLISQAAEGLQYAHEHGFVHRDIKPSNLMLATGAKPNAQVMVKILDLGLARALDQRPDADAPKAELTTTGQVMGTLDYMAPEQGGDAHQVDIRADIYSLGATLYKLLTGDSPYAEHAQKPPLQRLMAIAQLEPPAIRTKRPDIPEKLAAIVHRMLAKQPDQRFATPADVVQALAPYCAGADLAALVVSSGATRIIEARTATTTPLAAATEGCGAGRRLRTMLAGLAAFIALAAVIVIATRNGTVEVTSPDGRLPDDVKVVVTRGGEEVELLQADNQWSAKIVNGAYQVEIRAGADRFEIKDSQLIVSRLGRSVVALQVRKPEKEFTPTAGPSVTPRQPADVASKNSDLEIPAPNSTPGANAGWERGLSENVISGYIPQPAGLQKARWQMLSAAPSELLHCDWNAQGTRWATISKRGASASADIHVFEREGDSLSLRHIIPLSQVGRSLSWHPNGHELAFGDKQQLLILDASTGQVARHTPTQKAVGHVACSPSGKWIAISEGSGTSVAIWDFAKKTPARMESLGVAKTVDLTAPLCWHPTEPLLAVGSKTGVILVNTDTHNAETWKTVTTSIDVLAWHPGGNHLAVVSGGKLTILDRTGDAITTLNAGSKFLSWCDEGKRIVTTHFVVDVSDPAKPILHEDRAVGYPSTSPDGKYLAQAYYEKGWDRGASAFFKRGENPNQYLLGHKLVPSPKEEQVFAFAVQPQGQLAAFGGSFNLHWWDLRTKSRIASHPNETYAGIVSFSPDGMYCHAASGYEQKPLSLFRCRGTEIARAWNAGLAGPLRKALWSSDSRHLVTQVQKDSHVAVWNPETGDVARLSSSTGAGILDFALSAKGVVFAAGKSIEFAPFDALDKPEHVAELSRPVAQIVASSDGNYAAVIGSDNWLASINVAETKLEWEKSLDGQKTLSASFRTDRNTFWVLTQSQTTQWLEFDAAKGETQPQVVTSTDYWPPRKFQLSPRNRFIAAIDGGTAVNHLFALPGGRRIALSNANGPAAWTSDEQWLYATQLTTPSLMAYDGSTGSPQWQGINLPENQWASFTAAGEPIAQSEHAFEQLRWVVQHDDGRAECLTWREFETKYVPRIRKSSPSNP